MTSRTRYFERATIFVKYAFAKMMVNVFHVLTTCMVADIFTKATDEATFFRMRDELFNMSNRPAITAKVSRLIEALQRVMY